LSFCMQTSPHGKTVSESELSTSATELLQDYMLTVGGGCPFCWFRNMRGCVGSAGPLGLDQSGARFWGKQCLLPSHELMLSSSGA
jgi:hypothetical protein